MNDRIKNLIKKHGLSGVNSPKKTPGHPTKKGIVLAKEGDNYKLIRFGDQNMGHNYSPEARKSFKARHAKNIAKGKMSAAYWADKAFWGGAGADKKMPPKSQEYTRGLNKYQNGGKVKGEEEKYRKFKNSLPNNLKNTNEKDYDLRYLWENSGKPKDMFDAQGWDRTKSYEENYNQDIRLLKANKYNDSGMFGLVADKEEDGTVSYNYHGGSVEPKTMRFLKAKHHPTLHMEVDNYRNSTDPDAVDFRNKYDLDTSGQFYRYVRKYADGGKVATKTNPALWEKAKAQAKERVGGKHSARAMQLAVSIYKKAGGGYKGAKGSTSLSKWTKQDWTTSSGKPSEGKRRYLPKAAWSALSSAQKAATNKAKAEGNKQGKQFVPQPKAIAKKTAQYR